MMKSKQVVVLVVLTITLSISGGYYFSHISNLSPDPSVVTAINLTTVTHNKAVHILSSEEAWAEQNNVSLNETHITNLIMQNFVKLQNNDSFQHYLKIAGPLSYSLGMSFNFNKSRYNVTNHYGMDFVVAYYTFVYKATNGTGVQVWWALNIGNQVLSEPVVQYSHNS